MGVTRLPRPKTSTGRVIEGAVRKIRPRSAAGKIGVAVGAEIGGALGDGAHLFFASVARGMGGAEADPAAAAQEAQADGARAERWAEYVEQARREQREARRRVEEAFRQARAEWRSASGTRAADDGRRASSHQGAESRTAAPRSAGRSYANDAEMRTCRYRGKAVADYYEVLEVSPRARQTVIEKAYRALMRECHPDLGGDPRKAQLINEAYEVLRDPLERRRFDQENGLV